MALTPGTKLGAYEIQSPLGAGGMGEVYRATDTKLGRDIALKVLPSEMAQDPERLGRFRREAKALAQLDHPNIVAIHSVEESGGIHFLTMQLVEGQPLDRLICAGGLPLEQIVEIASALGDALAAAHEKGIVHRDLKPANVMVSNEGRVKVLDFGLAKDVRGSNLGDATMTSASRTEVGVVMGTPAYMSPEQTSGRPLDHRTDIFSLGVLLHEMATGRRPFEGTSSAELVSAILRDTPPSVTEIRPDLPSDLARIVRRCLEKDPRHRLQTARDVSNEFRDMARTASRPTPVSAGVPRMNPPPDSGAARADEGFWVAVLPFKHGGSTGDLAALADGLTDDTITGLSKFSYLRVIARSSSSRYSGQSVDVRTAGKELNARYVMEGTLRQAGSRLRLAVQLVDTVSGAHLWAENYERAVSAETIFELQDDLVPRIVSTVADMNGVLPRSMSEAVRSRDPEQLSPYEAVLRSFAYFERYTPEELSAARSGLETAVRKTPAYADAWAMLSYLCAQDYVHGYDLQANVLEIAATAARRAVELSPANHLAYFSLAQVLSYQKDFDSFRDAAERAVALNPMDGNSVALLGELLTYAGNAERGMQLAERAKQLNPNHPGTYWYADFYHAFSQGDYRSALAFALKVKLRGNPLAPMFIATASGQLGEGETAAKAADDLLKFRPELPALMRRQVAKVWNAEYGERFLEGLRKAGLEIPEAGATTGQKSSTQPTSSTLRTGAVPDSGATRADEGFWVAVLPFKYSGSNADLTALAEGLTDDIVTNMSKFSYLRVIARSSTARYAQQAADVRTAARELGARYVMEGSIRQAGAKVRMAVQLVDANAGSSLWAETYDRPFTPEETLDVLDDVVPRIVATVGDAQGILAHCMTEALRHRDPESLTPYEALLRSFGFHQHVSEDEHLAGITALESAVKKAPDHADCWAMLSWLYRAEYTHGYHSRPDSMDRSLTAARRAVNLAPASQLAHAALASAHFFRGELGEFRAAAERALALNRMQGYTTAFLGLHFAYSGNWERGCALAERATELNPNHPGWYWLPLVIDAYRQHDGERALQHALKINMPGLWTAQVALTVVNSQLEKMDQASNALRALLAARPDFAARAREDLSIWWQPEMVEQMLGDLGKAGLTPSGAAASPRTSSVTVPAHTASGESRTDEGFWVAVLPFKCAGASAELRALADGLSEEVITGLSRFSYLRVIARGSTAKYSSESGDVRTIGKELGARYVMEGSLRQAGSKLRLAVQLVDAVSGAHLWAENYERAFSPEAVFELQDDLVPRIVSTAADMNGVLTRDMSEALRGRAPEQLSPYEAVLRSFGYLQRVTPEELATSLAGLEQAVEKAPNYADAWAMLAYLCVQDYAQGVNLQADALTSGLTAARRAVEASPSNPLAYVSLAQVLFFHKEFQSFRNAAERAVVLNPMDGNSIAFLGELLTYAGDRDRGLALAGSAKQLNPNHPGWYWYANFYNAYRQGDYSGARDFALKINLPGQWASHAMLAAACGQLGEREAAAKAIRDLLHLRPNLGQTVRQEFKKWWDPEYVESVIDGLRKAGLEIAAEPSSPGANLVGIIESNNRHRHES
jgi:TolB-like protein/cytochrome c-type biogenesis protein CcmH/NrfG